MLPVSFETKAFILLPNLRKFQNNIKKHLEDSVKTFLLLYLNLNFRKAVVIIILRNNTYVIIIILRDNTYVIIIIVYVFIANNA